MKKHIPVIIAVLLIVCSIIMLINKYSNNDKDLDNNEDNVVEEVQTDYIDDEEEIVYSDDTSKYDINEEYFDENFVVHMKEVKYNDETGSYDFLINFRNKNEEVMNIEYPRISCEVNQQSVVLWNEGLMPVEGKKNVDVNVSCVANKEDKVNVVYVSTLFNGQNVTVKFGKK